MPESVIDPSEQIAQNPCQQGRESEFVITGRGGLPSTPSDVLTGEATGVGLVEAAPMESQGASENPSIQNSKPPRESLREEQRQIQNPIVPAQGWVFNERGEVVLVAYDPTVTRPQRLKTSLDGCQVP